jgi:hypothetical protein
MKPITVETGNVKICKWLLLKALTFYKLEIVNVLKLESVPFKIFTDGQKVTSLVC